VEVEAEAEWFIDGAGGASENSMKSLVFRGILTEIVSVFVFYFDFDFEIILNLIFIFLNCF